MELEKIKELFKEHAKKYDMNDIGILRKYYHSYRVMDLSMLIAKHVGFNDNDASIATVVGLLHDYARFEQWTKYKTYIDIDSIDHGDLAVKRLFDEKEIEEYCLDKDNYDEIYDAIKYHNKISIPSNLSKHNNELCKIIRDADKLDIFYLLINEKDLFQEDDNLISENIRNAFFNNDQLNRKEVKNKSDIVLLELAMIFDLNFDFSFNYIKENKIIDKLFNNIDNKLKFQPYFDYAKRYINERTDGSAR